MKYILIFLFALLCSVGYAQNPTNQYIGAPTTTVTSRGALKADSSLILPQFPDTASANKSPYIKFYPGNLIRVFNDIYMRNSAATKWELVNGGGSGGNNFIDSLRKVGDSVFARKYGMFVYQYTDSTQKVLTNNGLSFSGDTLQLGGTLIKNTNIKGNTQNLKIDSLKDLTISSVVNPNGEYNLKINDTVGVVIRDYRFVANYEQIAKIQAIADSANYLTKAEMSASFGEAGFSSITVEPSNIVSVCNSGSVIQQEGQRISLGFNETGATLLDIKPVSAELSTDTLKVKYLPSNTDTSNYKPVVYNATTGQLKYAPNYFSTDTTSLSNRINLKLNISDTASMLNPYYRSADTVNLRRVKYVGLTMPSAFNVTGSPIRDSGTIAVSGAGTSSQYIRGDGQLASFPTATTGGGASVSYYLNGSVNKGTFGGQTYYEMSRTAIIGAGTDFTRTNTQGDGLVAQFITDTITNLLIPAGNWNLELYFNASSGGGTPSFYVELYKYDGTNFTLISSNSTSPELIAFGTTINPYFCALAVPETILSGTDRLAIRVFVNTSGRSITLHTENSHLCQVITTFTTGLTAINGLTKQVQYFAVGTSGTDFNISSSNDTHTFNLPTASATNRGALSSADWSTFNGKVSPSDTSNKWITNVFRKTASDSVFFVRGGNNNFAFRDSAGGANIYNSNGSLTGARTLTLNSQPLTIAGSTDATSTRFHANGNVTVGGTTSPNTDSAYKFTISGSGNVFKIRMRQGFTGSDINFVQSDVYNLISTGAFLQIGSSGGTATFGGGSGSRTNIGCNAQDVVTPVVIGYESWRGSQASAMLDIRSTTRGFLQPQMTTSQMNAISTPATGLSVFNTTDSLEYVYRGTSSGWQKNVTYTRTNDIGLLNGADQRLMIEPTTNVIAGRALTVEAGSTQAGGTSAFAALSQTSRNYAGITSASNNDIYVAVDGGDIFRRTGGTGNFTSLSQTSRQWFGMCSAPNGDVFASVRSGDIYRSTGGTGTFTALSAGNRNWRGMCAAPNGDIYAVEQGGDIWKSTNNGTTFTALSQTARQWYGIAAAPNGDIFATEAIVGGNIYKQTGGTGNFVSVGFTGRQYTGIAISSNNDLYVSVINGDIFKQTNSTGSLVSLNQTSRNWLQMAAAPNGDVYATIGTGDIYAQSGGTANLNGGTLVLQSGVGKGTGTSTINFNTGTTLASGSTLQTASTKMTILGNGNVGIGTTSPSAKLELSDTARGFLQTRMTTTQMNAIVSPSVGLQVFNTTDSSNYVYRGTGGGWTRLATATPGASETQQTYTSGASVTCNNNTTWLIIDPASLQSTLTVNLPSVPSPNQDVLISFGGTLTTGVVVNTLTISPTPLQSTTPSFIEVGEYIGYRWNATNSKWYRVN